MIYEIRINGRLPSMNEVIEKNRINKFAGAKLKKEITEQLAWCFKSQFKKKIEKKVNVTFKWYCKDKRRDKDNVMSAQKFIFDGLQKAGIIKNDGWKEIGEIKHEFYIDKHNERVEIFMEEINENS